MRAKVRGAQHPSMSEHRPVVGGQLRERRARILRHQMAALELQVDAGQIDRLIGS